MNTAHLLRFFVVRLLPMLGLLGAQAIAQTDPPGRVGRLNHAQGAVTFSPAGDNEWIDAELNRPLTRGDRLWTDKGSRAEIQIGSSAVRMDGQTQIEILVLDDQSAQISVTQGTVYVRVRSLPEGENFEIDTPNLAYRAAYPGDYRIDVDAARGSTRVTIHSGTGAVYGEGGQALPLGGGQQITFRGRGLAQLSAQESPPQDNFDRWAAERNRREDQSVAARYVPREVVGYQQLDAHGQWSQDATHGPVWHPQWTAANWAPYRHGRWDWIVPWGWTWIDDAPWGFAPFHYGRWAMVGSRWAWVPGRLGLRPVYAPALVAFIGGGSGGVNWSISIGSGRPGVAWFPLAPGESWQPGYRASPVYISNLNRNMSLTNASYAHQRRPEALTAISAEDFHRGRPVRGSLLRVAGNVLTSAQIVPPPPMPERSGIIGRDRTAIARAAPPQAEIRQVTASPAQQQQQADAQSRVAEQAKAAQQAKAAEQAKAEQAKLAEQAKIAEQAKAAEQAQAAEQAKALQQAKLAEQAKAAEQAKLAQQAKAAEQARLAQAAAAAKLAQQAKTAPAPRVAQAKPAQASKLAEQSKRADQVKREQAVAKRAETGKREQPAKLEQAKLEQARREQAAKRERDQPIAKRAEQSRKEAQAKREVLARREAHAQQVELARRAAERDAQALREQRAQREEQARRLALEREQIQREAWQRQQQVISEQWRRDHQAWEEQQRERTRQRPDLRNDRHPPPQPEVWQRGVPILNPGRTS